MNKILSILLITAGALFIGRSTIQNHETESEDKFAPSDWMLQRYSYPDMAPNINAYQKAMAMAATKAAYKTSAPGFDLDWTLQGPNNIGGRFNVVAISPADKNVIYAGSAHGGLFKTTDAANWKPIFDEMGFQSIGAITIDPKNTNTVYVGTGDPNISGDPAIGNGLYKTTDGGKTWTNIGLTDKYIVSKIVIHPDSSNVLYVATMGNPFERDNNRGLYKSSDGGKTWKNILFAGNDAGVIDLIVDPVTPKVMYASVWGRIRNNHESFIYSNQNRVYKSVDGGYSWNILLNGLPNTPVSRIGLAISPKDHQKLYAIVVDSFLNINGVFYTTNGGDKWDSVAIDQNVRDNAYGSPEYSFGWYFAKVFIDPEDDNVIYVPGVELYRCEANINLWQKISPPWYTYEVHADEHDLQWVDSKNFIIATDGGLYQYDKVNQLWKDIEDIPVTQFYHVAYNPFNPRVYYGGAQDNGTSSGNLSGINYWERLAGGDGFKAIFDPEDSTIFYTETQNGNISTPGNWNVSASLPAADKRGWDMPYIMSSFYHEVLYTGTDHVYRIAEPVSGTWVQISPDLTRGNIYGAKFHYISALAESPKDDQLMYAGTSDGKVWRKDDQINVWTDISSGLPDRYVTSIATSNRIKTLVYIAHSGYRDNDRTSHLHMSTDRGNTWKDFSGDLPPIAINDILVDPKSDSILFIATDAGVYGTINGGQNWLRIGSNLPIGPVNDIEFNPKLNQLIAGTYSRSIYTYPLDSIFRKPVVTSIKNQIQKDFAIFPNPVVKDLNYSLKMPLSGTLQIFNLEGKKVLEFNMPKSANGSINVSALTPGCYIAKVKSGSESYNLKFLKL